LHTEIIAAGMSSYAATPLIIALCPSHSNITRFRPWLTIATEIHFDRTKKIKIFLRRQATLTFMIRVLTFRDPLCGEISHVQIFMNNEANPLTWDTQLLSYWCSRNMAVFQN
jgi:hypothetical protein